MADNKRYKMYVLMSVHSNECTEIVKLLNKCYLFFFPPNSDKHCLGLTAVCTNQSGCSRQLY